MCVCVYDIELHAAAHELRNPGQARPQYDITALVAGLVSTIKQIHIISSQIDKITLCNKHVRARGRLSKTNSSVGGQS